MALLEPLQPHIDSFVSQYTEIFAKNYDWEDPNHDEYMFVYTHHFPWTAVTLYLSFIFLYPKLVTKNINLKYISAVWNFVLCIASLVMALGIIIPYSLFIYKHGMWILVSDPDARLFSSIPRSTMLFWGYQFAFSKYVELGDTVILLMKRPQRTLQFLHWYHHCTVLLFTWYAEAERCPVGFIFISMNATIHTFMYYYYFRADLGSPPKWGVYLTVGQISQMFFGIAALSVWGYQYYVLKMNTACFNPELVLAAGALMYTSYLVLFVKFFVNKYFGSGSRAPTTQQKPGKGRKSKRN